MAKKTKTRPWDVTEHLETKEDMAAYLEAALEDGDPALVAAALGDIARAFPSDRALIPITGYHNIGKSSPAVSPQS